MAYTWDAIWIFRRHHFRFLTHRSAEPDRLFGTKGEKTSAAICAMDSRSYSNVCVATAPLLAYPATTMELHATCCAGFSTSRIPYKAVEESVFCTNAMTMLHLTAISSFGGIILAMISRVSLGHTGRPLIVSKWMICVFIATAISGLTSIILPFVLPVLMLMAYWISILFWCGAFTWFVLFYAKMRLSAPR